jgi:periplasmic divalent cation tolerance protein
VSEATPGFVVLCTCPSADVAKDIASELVAARLAACVNVVSGIRSIYRWEGKVCDDAEHLMIIKTTGDRLSALQTKVVALHPYSCPEVIALPIQAGHTPYLDWLVAETRE